MPSVTQQEEADHLFDLRRLPLLERQIIIALTRSLREQHEMKKPDDLPAGVVPIRRTC